MRAADFRFVLPAPVGRALVLGPLDDITEALREAGVTVHEHLDVAVDLVVATPDRVREAVATQAPVVVITGATRRFRLRKHGFAVERLLCLDGVSTPRIIVPTRARRALRYTIQDWSRPHERWRRLRNRIVLVLMRLGLVPRRELLTVATRAPFFPFILRAAEELGVTAGEWLLDFRSGESEMRGVIHVFGPGEAEPAWVVKFARAPRQDKYFDDDERGFGLVEQAGPPMTEHAPKFLGRTRVADVTVSLETAARSTPLPRVLQGPGHQAQKLEVIDRIASWIVDVGRSTATQPSALDKERELLETFVVPHWLDAGAPSDLLLALPSVPGVLIHGDLTPGNIVVDNDNFTVVDWEDVRAPGLPLWDLVTFLGEALVLIGPGGVTVDEARLALFRGDLPTSSMLFEWVERACDSLSIPPADVGRIVTLCWCYHGARSWLFQRRTEFSDDPHARFARAWLGDARLGCNWMPVR